MAEGGNERGRTRRYMAYDGGSRDSRLLRRAQDPSGRLMMKARRGIRIDETAIFDTAEGD